MNDATGKLAIGLNAVVVAVEPKNPQVLVVDGRSSTTPNLPALPFGPFQPGIHKTLELGLRSWVETQTQLRLGYVEQLYTFGDRARLRAGTQLPTDTISVSYVALVRRPDTRPGHPQLEWSDWYEHFPWEDWRGGEPHLLGKSLLPALLDWVRESPDSSSEGKGLNRQTRFRLAFGCTLPKTGDAIIVNWDDERVLERYELMYEAGLVQEAINDGRHRALRAHCNTGLAMSFDHRRILATAIARLRGKLKYRPVVFELMPPRFTLTELQRAVEQISGRKIHKQNFRRLVETGELVERTGATSSQTGGRPAALYRFRRAVLQERPAPGLRIGSS